jgi:hypothetical protein
MSELSPQERDVIDSALTALMWRMGDLRFLLHPGQRDLMTLMDENQRGTFVLEIARRYGKTFMLMAKAFSVCIRKPKARVVYGAPTLKHLEEFVLPAIDKISQFAPHGGSPYFNHATGHLEFPNGSYVHLFGADDKRKADRGRGPEADLGIFDEAGFCPLLRYVVRSVLRPQLLHTGGRIILASTPAEEPDHDFTALAERAEANGLYARRTVWENPLLTRQQIERFIEDDAKDEGLGVEAYKDSDDFRREYLAERVINKLLVVLPEWSKKREQLIQNVPRPKYFDGMTVLDFGGHDPHAAIFGYWHFELAKWVIEDELLLRNDENTAQLAQAVKQKEAQLWGVDCWDGTLRAAFEDPSDAITQQIPDWMRDVLTQQAPTQPYSRWADNDIELVRDLHQLHGITFIPTAKDNLQLQVNNLRVLINSNEVLVNPRCTGTDRHWRSTTWENDKRKKFARRGGEHGDLLAAGIYGARNLNRRNPIPDGLTPTTPLRELARRKMREREDASVFLEGPLADRILERED